MTQGSLCEKPGLECPLPGEELEMPRLTYRAALIFMVAALACPSLALARRRAVRPGQSIRAALLAARPGDRIEVPPGVYHEGAPGDLNALTVTADNIQLVGLS